MLTGSKSLFASLLLHGAVVVGAAAWVLHTPQVAQRAEHGDDEAGTALFVDSLRDESDALSLDESLQSPAETASLSEPPTPVAPLPDISAAQSPMRDIPIVNIVTTLGPSSLAPVSVPPTIVKRSGKKSIATSARGGTRGGLAGKGAGGIYIPARYSRCPAPAFPSEAKKTGLTGTVLLLVEVDESGRPASVCIHRTSGHELLDSAALRTVQNWRFEPARLDGQAVSSRAEVPVRFAS